MFGAAQRICAGRRTAGRREGQTPRRVASAPHRLLCPNRTAEDKEPPPAHGVCGADPPAPHPGSSGASLPPYPSALPGPAHHVAARSPARSASSSLAARLRPHTSRVGPPRTSQTPEPDLRRAGSFGSAQAGGGMLRYGQREIALGRRGGAGRERWSHTRWGWGAVRGFGVSRLGALAAKWVREDAGRLAGPGAGAGGGRLGFCVRLFGCRRYWSAPGVLSVRVVPAR